MKIYRAGAELELQITFDERLPEVESAQPDETDLPEEVTVSPLPEDVKPDISGEGIFGFGNAH